MLRTIRLTLAIVFFALITLLFLDFSGTLHGYMGWMAKIQFLPALLALNVGVVLLLVVLTLLFGRVYCSVICPLGVFQDVISRFAGKRKKNRFRYSPARKWLRYGMLALFFVTLVAGVRFHAVASLLEPYSSYGRIASNLFSLSLSLKLIRHLFLKIFVNTNRSFVKVVDTKMPFVLYSLQTRKYRSC